MDMRPSQEHLGTPSAAALPPLGPLAALAPWPAQGLKELDREGAGDIEAASLPGQGSWEPRRRLGCPSPSEGRRSGYSISGCPCPWESPRLPGTETAASAATTKVGPADLTDRWGRGGGRRRGQGGRGRGSGLRLAEGLLETPGVWPSPDGQPPGPPPRGVPEGRPMEPMDMPRAPRHALPANQWGCGGRGLPGFGRSAAFSASFCSPALNLGLDGAELCALPKGVGRGRGGSFRGAAARTG